MSIDKDKESNTIHYFLPGLNQVNAKRTSAEITQQLQRDFKDVFNGTGCFDGTFALPKPRQQTISGTHEMHGLHTTKAFQRGVRITPITRHHITTRYG